MDSDGSVLVNTQGENRRPPAVVSKGAMLTVKFEAHDFTQAVGFRARYDFVETQEWPEKPNSRSENHFESRIIIGSLDCDEMFEGYGGEIKLDGNSHLANTYVDCIWVIGRFQHTSRTFDRIYLKVEKSQKSNPCLGRRVPSEGSRHPAGDTRGGVVDFGPSAPSLRCPDQGPARTQTAKVPTVSSVDEDISGTGSRRRWLIPLTTSDYADSS